MAEPDRPNRDVRFNETGHDIGSIGLKYRHKLVDPKVIDIKLQK